MSPRELDLIADEQRAREVAEDRRAIIEWQHVMIEPVWPDEGFDDPSWADPWEAMSWD